jgi:hypothetical protein
MKTRFPKFHSDYSRSAKSRALTIMLKAARRASPKTENLYLEEPVNFGGCNMPRRAAITILREDGAPASTLEAMAMSSQQRTDLRKRTIGRYV